MPTPSGSFREIQVHVASPDSLRKIEGVLRVPNMQHRQFIAACLRVVYNSEHLLACSKESVLSAMLEAANTGIVPGLAGLAYFIPRGGKCYYELSYRGLMQLAYKHPRVLNIEPHVVMSNDEFDYEPGRRPPILHRPTASDNPGEPVAVWVLTEIAGPRDSVGRNYQWFWVRDLFERHRSRSQSYNKAPTKSPWTTDTVAMLIKSAIKEAMKFTPITTELANAIGNDGVGDRIEEVSNLEPPPVPIEATVSEPQPAQRSPQDAKDFVPRPEQLEGQDPIY